MLKRKLILAVTIIGIAAITGVIAGQYYAGSMIGVAKAEDSMASKLPVPPAWADLQVVYLQDAMEASAFKAFAAESFATEINARVVTEADDVVRHSQTKGLDILIISKSALARLDPQWAAEQYRRGTAFVGLNITPQELGALINDPGFANQWGDKTFAEPFLSKAMMKVSGNPEQVEAAWNAGLIGPEHDVDLAKAGFDKVFMLSVGGYGPIVSDDGSIITDLDDIRYNLNKQSLVKPTQP